MNSAEEIAKYKENIDSSYYSPTLSKRLLGYTYDLPEKSPKKDKKWSISSLFRRKKKEETESSSEDDSQKKGLLSRKKKKSEKKKKSLKHVGTFDHVVLSRNTHLYTNGHNGHEETAIFSDPSGGFNGYTGRALPKTQVEETTKKPMKNSRESLDEVATSRATLSATPDSVTKKGRKNLAKIRAEARRVNLKHDTSSDEDSQRSASSSRFRSDESLGNLHRDGSVNRRSRAARTERYLKRHSKDGENPKDYLRLSKSDVENSGLHWRTSDDNSNRSPSRSPLISTKPKSKTTYTSVSQSPSISGLSTIPPSHGNHGRIKVSNSTSNPSYKPPLSMNDYNCSTKKLPDDYFDTHRSLSCDANIHKAPSIEIDSDIIHVQLPLGKPHRYRNLSLVDPRHVSSAHVREPPPPPPRDPKRLVTAQYYDNVRPNSYYFDSSGQMRSKSLNVPGQSNVLQHTKKYSSFNLHPNCRSTSEDHLPKNNIQLLPRPSSATPEVSSPHRYIQRPPEIKTNPESYNYLTDKIQRPPEIKTNPESYNYLTDKKPRSRKPIFIQTNGKLLDTLSVDKTGTQKALDFWKQKEGSTNHQDKCKIKLAEPKSPQMFTCETHVRSPRSPQLFTCETHVRSPRSPQMFTCETHVQTQVFLPSVLQNDINSENLANATDSLVVNETLRPMSPFKPISPREKSPRKSPRKSPTLSSTITMKEDRPIVKDEEIRRKSSNLEEALDELEAIYNSLRLGDEELLERAEQREKDAAAKRAKERSNELYPNWNMSRGALSDSSFSYEPFDTVDSPRRKRFARKSQTVDRRADDMAFRKMNKERAATINDPQSMVAKVSYLRSSPVFGRHTSNDHEVPNINAKEPDITLDDVVYRNVKFANSTPKIVEPQPPFGIPLGPITPAANSDYLHAVPDNIYRPTFKPRKIPDLVKDDLAFRNLRKDQSKEPALPPLSPDDLKNNNACEARLDMSSLKKRRAVRSLSANIGSLINKDILSKGFEKYKYNNNSENDSNTLTDIADAMEIARQVLKEKENKISATKKAFLSDTDTSNGNPDIMAESRMNFLNSLKMPASPNATMKLQRVPDSYLHAKPPRGLTPERKVPRSPKGSPSHVSPLEEKLGKRNESRDSSLDDLLTALATEARETNERITSELKHVAEGRRSPLPLDGNLNKHELNKTLSDIDAVSEQAKLCEKLLEGVVDSTELMASAKSPSEEVEQIHVEPVLMESVANIVLTTDDSKIANKPNQVACESDHDYENLISDEDLNLDEVSKEEAKCTSPFEEHKAELIASFQELKKNVDLDIVGSRNTETKETETDKKDDTVKDGKENNDAVTGEESVGVLDDIASSIEECAYVPYVDSSFNISNQKTYVSNCDMAVNPTNRSDVDVSSGFCSNGAAGSLASLDSCGQTQLDSLESLKSPKLVLETSKLSKNDGNRQILENQSMLCYNDPSTSTDFRGVNRARDSESRHILDDNEKPTPAWYRDPATLAVACSYGFACAHQLASLDFVAILGILFAVLSFIAALIL